ncbi:MAG: NAD(+) diphosphatase [Azoarcus sp.]|jgi:NAD+ diphosphatase|nr:NAD(+) diphosphatase [Azoarcus sp.]
MALEADFEPGYSAYPPPAQDNAPDAAPALVFPFSGQRLLVGLNKELPRPEDLQPLGHPLRAICFGTLSGRKCVLSVWPPEQLLPAGLETSDFRVLWDYHWPPGRLKSLVRAKQLAVWLLHHQHCGVCGQGMMPSPNEIACLCPACGHKAYPHISPVAIGLVVKGSEILLARSPHFAPGMYSALAGFVEAGESAEECLCREIREEAGIEIQNIRYFGSQSWPYPHSLMIGFIADYLSGELTPQKNEIEDLGWFSPDSLPVLPHPASLARKMIGHVLGLL